MRTISKRLAVVGVLSVSFCLAETRPLWHSGLLPDVPVALKGSSAVTEQALQLTGAFSLHMDAAAVPEKPDAFSISAWIRPLRFDRYNEIFRIEAPEGRVLFSFQENGTVLALGLDVNGLYRECDAQVQPEALIDGCWHFAAAVFDGREMRVYLDNRPIGSLAHAGSLRVARGSGFVGSSQGGGNFSRAVSTI